MEERKLYRSRRERMLGGVCGGVADYYELDPSVVRLLAVVIAIVGNAAAVIAYIVMWIVVPEEPEASGAPAPSAASTPPAPAPAPAPAPVSGPAAAGVAPTTRSDGVTRAARGGAVWLGVALVLVGAAVLADQVLPGIDLWGFWPATVMGIVFIAVGIATMFTPGGDE